MNIALANNNLCTKEKVVNIVREDGVNDSYAIEVCKFRLCLAGSL